MTFSTITNQQTEGSDEVESINFGARFFVSVVWHASQSPRTYHAVGSETSRAISKKNKEANNYDSASRRW